MQNTKMKIEVVLKPAFTQKRAGEIQSSVFAQEEGRPVRVRSTGDKGPKGQSQFRALRGNDDTLQAKEK